MNRRLSMVGFLFAAMLLGVVGASAQDGVRGTRSLSVPALKAAPWFGNGLAVADFDSDSEPDGAVLSEAGSLNGQRLFRINFHLTSGINSSLTFSSTEAFLDISAADVNRDGSPDIVVENPLSHQRLQVFLNDGHGAFEKVATGSFTTFDHSAPQWRPSLSPQNAPILYLAMTREKELAETESKDFLFLKRVEPCSFWPKTLLAHRGARAPSSSRAPPAPLSL